MNDEEVHQHGPGYLGNDGEFFAVESQGFLADPFGPTPLLPFHGTPHMQQYMAMGGRNLILPVAFPASQQPVSTLFETAGSETAVSETDEEVAPGVFPGAFPNIACSHDYVRQESYLVEFQALPGPDHGPPRDAEEAQNYVKLLFDSMFDFSTFTPSAEIPTTRRVEDICCHPKMEDSEKLAAILGADHQMSGVMLEAFCYHMLHIAAAMHNGNWRIYPWQPEPCVEQYTSFVRRWLAMIMGFKEAKSLVKSVIVEQAFAERYIMAPEKETKIKLTNKCLNDRRQGMLAAGKAAQQASAQKARGRFRSAMDVSR